MELVKKTDNYTIYKKKSGRYAVKDKDKKYISDKDKEKITNLKKIFITIYESVSYTHISLP